MKATWTGVTFPLPRFSGFLDLLCFPIFFRNEKARETKNKNKRKRNGDGVSDRIKDRFGLREGKWEMAPWLREVGWETKTRESLKLFYFDFVFL